MGAWDVSITGNDTAMDLRLEYTCAFYYYKDDIETALKKLDEYFESRFDCTDEEEVCGYYYSLADFMWKKGILTEGIKKKVLDMIDSGYGLELWAESGDDVLKERKKTLDKFRAKITSPMGAAKKVKPDFNMKDIFTDGDLIAIQLQTKGKQYVLYKIGYRYISPEDFEAFDGKYVLIQKIYSEDWGNSQVVPELHDYAAYFRLFDGVYDDIPEITDISMLKDASIYRRRYQDSEPCLTPVFKGTGTASKMSFFRKHNYKIIGNFTVEQKYLDAPVAQDFDFCDKTRYNAESELLGAMGDKEKLKLPEKII